MDDNCSHRPADWERRAAHHMQEIHRLQQTHRQQLLGLANAAFERCEAEDRAEAASMSEVKRTAKNLFMTKCELAALKRQLEEANGNKEHASDKNQTSMHLLKKEMYRTHDALREEDKY